jgi:hypothetical protein
MVSVEARALTWLKKKQSKKLITSVGDMMPDMTAFEEAKVYRVKIEPQMTQLIL